MVVNFTITPTGTPIVKRYCSHCGCASDFVCSGNFRVNAQQRNLDVWLIYKCKKCGCTFNMDIYTRVNPQELERGLYEAFLANDADVARYYAFDQKTLSQNHVEAGLNDLCYTIKGEALSRELLIERDLTLKISVSQQLSLRLDRILSEKIPLSRAKIKDMLAYGAIRLVENGQPQPIPANYKLKTGCTLLFDGAKVRGYFCDDNQAIPYEKDCL